MTASARHAWHCANDRGAGTVFAIAGGAVLFAVTFGVAVGADLIATRGRAQTSADLAALAADQAALDLRADPCAAAVFIARSNGGELTACVVRPDGAGGIDAEVTVTARVTGPARAAASRLGLDLPTAHAWSRAGTAWGAVPTRPP